MPTLIFVHGACVRDAQWWWSKMVDPLGELGIPSVVEFEAGHHPFLSRPEAIAQTIATEIAHAS